MLAKGVEASTELAILRVLRILRGALAEPDQPFADLGGGNRAMFDDGDGSRRVLLNVGLAGLGGTGPMQHGAN